MFKRLLGIFGALALLVSFIPLHQVSAVDWWDTDYHYRLPITIDADLIDTDLTDFPVYIELSETSGLTSVDISHIFDTLGEDYLKLAVVSGVSQCYVEVVEWDTANDYAELHTKIPEVDDTLDTVIYLYYDAAVEDNTTYVGLTGTLPAQNVWDSNFVFVSHMNNNPADSTQILDSTSNANHGTKGAGTAAPTEVDGLVGKAQSFDGVDDLITLPLNSTLLSEFTYQILSRLDSYKLDNTQVAYMHDNSPGTKGWMLRREATDRVNFYVYRQGEAGATVASQTPSYDEYLLWTAIFKSTQMSLQINDGTPDTENFDASTIVASGQNDRIGAPVENTSNHTWKDLISEIRISKTARDGGWIGTTNLSLRDELNTVGVLETYPYPPTNLTSEIDTNNIRLNWTLGVNATGVKIIRGNVDYPTSLTDGIEVYSGTGTTYTDEGIVDDTTTYYYSAFSYNDNFTNTAIYAITSIGGEALFLLILVLLPLALMIAGFALRRGSMAMAAMGAWFILCVYSYMQTGEIYNAIFWISIALTITSGLEGAMIMRKGEEQAEDAIAYENELDIASKNIDDRIAALRAKRR